MAKKAKKRANDPMATLRKWIASEKRAYLLNASHCYQAGSLFSATMDTAAANTMDRVLKHMDTLIVPITPKRRKKK